MCDTCRWFEQLDRIDEMVGSNEYDDRAIDRLTRLYDAIEQAEHVATNQRARLDHIEARNRQLPRRISSRDYYRGIEDALLG